MFQNSGECKEVLNTQYKLLIRNSDALGDINQILLRDYNHQHQRLK